MISSERCCAADGSPGAGSVGCRASAPPQIPPLRAAWKPQRSDLLASGVASVRRVPCAQTRAELAPALLKLRQSIFRPAINRRATPRLYSRDDADLGIAQQARP